MDTQVEIFDDTGSLAGFLGSYLKSKLENTGEGGAFSILLPGGETPRLVLNHIALQFRNDMEWKKIRLFWGDERCVPPDHNDSNFRMVKESLLNHVDISEENIHRIRGEEDPCLEAARYSDVVRETILIAGDVPRFDLVLLGLGQDGHTASLFPGKNELFYTEKLFESVKSPYNNQRRISATGRLINNASQVFFMVTGESKAAIVAHILKQEKGSETLPASMVKPVHGELSWLLDAKASQFLS